MDKAITKIYKKIPFCVKLSFLTTIVFGLITHMYFITNRLPIDDDMYQIVSNMDYSISGRWFLKYLARISSDFSLPWFNGFFSIILVALATSIIVYSFKIKSPINTVVFSAIMISFPALSEMMLFINNVDADMMALLFSTIAFICTINKKYQWTIPAIILSVLSLATYQLYYLFTLALFLIYLIYQIIEEKITTKNLIILVGKMIFVAIISASLYLFITKNCIKTPLSSYQGFNNMGNFNTKDIINGTKDAYTNFWKYINLKTIPNYFYKFLRPIFILSFLVSIFLSLYIAIKKKLKTNRIILLSFLLVVLPFAINLIYIARDQSGYLAFRMLYNYVLFYFFIILILDIAFKNKKYFIKNNKKIIEKIFDYGSALIITSFAISVFCNIRVSNQLYFKIEMDFRNGIQYTNRLLSRIETLPGYNKHKFVYIVGSPDSRTNFGYRYWPNELTGFTMPYTMTDIPLYGLFIQNYFGFANPIEVFPNGEESKKRIPTNLKREADMLPLYPEKGSIIETKDYILVHGSDLNTY